MSLDLDAIRRVWLLECPSPAADYRPVMAALAAEVERLRASTLPITCVVCGVPVEGVRCPDCQPKIVTGEEGKE